MNVNVSLQKVVLKEMICKFCGGKMVLKIDDKGPKAKKMWYCNTCGRRQFFEEEIKLNYKEN